MGSFEGNSFSDHIIRAESKPKCHFGAHNNLILFCRKTDKLEAIQHQSPCLSLKMLQTLAFISVDDSSKQTHQVILAVVRVKFEDHANTALGC